MVCWGLELTRVPHLCPALACHALPCAAVWPALPCPTCCAALPEGVALCYCYGKSGGQRWLQWWCWAALLGSNMTHLKRSSACHLAGSA